MPVLPTRSQRSQYGGKNAAGAPVAGFRAAPPPPVLLQKGPAQGLEHTNDRQLSRIQQSIRQAVSVAHASPIQGAIALEGLSLTNGSNTVSHGLPQAWRGALLTTPSAEVTYSVAAMTPPSLNDTQLVVNVSGNVTCTLLVW
jgi:hypothetical protein